MTGRPGHAKCWVQFLEGDAKKFMDALEVVEDKTSGSVYRKGAAAEFGKEYDVETTGADVSRHLKRDCKCRPQT